MWDRDEYRDINGQLIGFSELNIFGGRDYFDPGSRRVGFTDENNSYDNGSRLVARGDIGAGLFNLSEKEPFS